jgi:hypothetical protein
MKKRKKFSIRFFIGSWGLAILVVGLFCGFAERQTRIERKKMLEVSELVKISPTPTSVPTPTPTPTNTPTPTPTNTPTPLPDPFYGQSTFKSYENYLNITRKTSPAYKLQQEAYTGNYGIRMVGDRYCVAMGGYWAKEIGTKMNVYLETGEMIPVILGDNKQDRHTLNNQRIGADNRDVLEFIVDVSEIPTKVKNCGNFNVIFKGKVSYIVVVETGEEKR